jgi:hypothetical protein
MNRFGNLLSSLLALLFATTAFIIPQAAAAKDKEDPAQTAVQRQCSISLDNGAVGVGCALYTVPLGKRLVIEHASARCFSGNGSLIDEISLSGSFEGASRTMHLVVAPQIITGSTSTFAASEHMRMYADPAPFPVSMQFTRNAGNVFTQCQFSIAGYLVDVP